ncbi:MAG: DNA gyrase/topoisomerase IV subunit A, partial [Bacteroidia bacterium]|nr:DNA gyrase/topoisomerase IV subunit A [Bacteroidia bacterium]
MAKNKDSDNSENLPENNNSGTGNDHNVILVSGMYQNWFLDYASYVILERAVPAIEDGLKPVQRRIMHSMWEMEDGRYNKVANVIGNTMKYHPHGDASIGDAMVQLGQKDLLIDTQGNWGNILTGDFAAAPRYIEARLSKFALEVAFNPKTTTWLASYDGRNKEPETLPMKFPLLLAQGVEGIAVGLACKILPHNFNELIDASIKVLRGRKTDIMPDFPTGGSADFSNYSEGLRGARVRVRAKISQLNKKTLIVSEIPFGTTTQSLIDSILAANDKGKIKIKRVEDNTSENVEVLIHLAPDVSPDKTIDALYAFTDCEISISPNACIIENDKPRFVGVNEMLKISTLQTLELLKKELEIELHELGEQWHFSSLEKIFIKEEMYIDFKKYSDKENLFKYLYESFKPHKRKLNRAINDEDLERLTKIPMIRITRFDSIKADDVMKDLEKRIDEVKHHLANLTEFAVEYFTNLKKKYGVGRERKTEIRSFENIEVRHVVVANQKLYVNREEGFIGYGLKKDEFVCECSDIDDIIAFTRDGKMKVVKVADKAFMGKDIIYV